MPDPTPQQVRPFRLVWLDLDQEVHGVQFPTGRVVLDDPLLLVGVRCIRLIEAHGLDALNLLGMPRVQVEWAPEVTPQMTAVIEAARKEAELIRLVAAVVPGSMSRGPRAQLLAAVDALEAPRD